MASVWREVRKNSLYGFLEIARSGICVDGTKGCPRQTKHWNLKLFAKTTPGEQKNMVLASDE